LLVSVKLDLNITDNDIRIGNIQDRIAGIGNVIRIGGTKWQVFSTLQAGQRILFLGTEFHKTKYPKELYLAKKNAPRQNDAAHILLFGCNKKLEVAGQEDLSEPCGQEVRIPFTDRLTADRALSLQTDKRKKALPNRK